MKKSEVDQLQRKSSDRVYDLQDRLIDFAVRVIALVESLPKSRTVDHIAGQLLRSGTSAAANYGEAQSGESHRDFVHKLKIALKELRETFVWLEIIRRRALIEPSSRMEPIVSECNELIAIFVASIGTARRNANQARVSRKTSDGQQK